MAPKRRKFEAAAAAHPLDAFNTGEARPNGAAGSLCFSLERRGLVPVSGDGMPLEAQFVNNVDVRLFPSPTLHGRPSFCDGRLIYKPADAREPRCIVFTPTSATPTGDNNALLILGYSTVQTTCVPLDFLLSSEIGAGAEVEALVRQFGWIECIDSRPVRCAVCVPDANSPLPPGYTPATL